MKKILMLCTVIVVLSACEKESKKEQSVSLESEVDKQQVVTHEPNTRIKEKRAAIIEPKFDFQTVLDGEHRSKESKARDKYRNPKQTLEFFDVQKGMTIVEIWPGAGGWYTEILAPLIGVEGTIYAAHFDPQSDVEYFSSSYKKYQRKLIESPYVYNNIKMSVFAPPEKLFIAPENSADRVLTFRNVHNWIRGGQQNGVLAFSAMYKALKPGGILGVVEHRLPSSIDFETAKESGYMPQELVIAMAEEAGFKLVASSEINANPKDTADHPAGVWTLPPSLRLKDKDQAKYLSIGESDRMTLKFIKQ